MKITSINFWFLKDEIRGYLETVGEYIDRPYEDHSGFAVYQENGLDEVYFVFNYVLKNVKEFEKTAPKGLYRGGALLSLMTDYGQVVIPDERYGWLRLIGGIARFNEGDDLIKTAIREAVIEELAILSKDEKTRFVPKGIDGVSFSVHGWDFSAERLEEVGEIEIINHFFNDQNKAFEIVVQWTIPGELKILHNEDWFKGGMSGISPLTIDEKGRITGIYSGRQGLIKIPVSAEPMKLHPTLSSILNI